ncbi:unnamed protein product [Eruca vesicaria subsp. sativa]|uniref:Transmembrane protein n=1 Tax=Eruca vesicaria subsp. sativa TaxID=29727 RepID=A0ABC8M8Q8_ERUVS|nr:unnamed protein product [Eruca vesicaria subsp. sativa]
MLAVGIVSTDENVSQAPSPVEYFYTSPSTSPSPEVSDVNHDDVSGMEEKSSGGGKKAGIAFGLIAAASMVSVGGYMLKKRRDNIRRSRFEYAAAEFF